MALTPYSTRISRAARRGFVVDQRVKTSKNVRFYSSSKPKTSTPRDKANTKHYSHCFRPHKGKKAAITIRHKKASPDFDETVMRPYKANSYTLYQVTPPFFFFIEIKRKMLEFLKGDLLMNTNRTSSIYFKFL